MELFAHADQISGEFVLLSLHVLPNVFVTVLEDFLNDVVDAVLEGLELSVYGLQHAVVEGIDFVVDSIDLISQFVAEVLQALD